MAGVNPEELDEDNIEFDVNKPDTWLYEVEVGDQKVNVPVMLLVAKEANESST